MMLIGAQYISLCPEVTDKTKKNNFYLCSLEKPNPAQWYGVQVVRKCTLAKTVSKMLKDAKLDGFFMNHSLRRTGPHDYRGQEWIEN